MCPINDQRRKPRKKKARTSPPPTDQPDLAIVPDIDVNTLEEPSLKDQKGENYVFDEFQDTPLMLELKCITEYF